MHKLIAQLQQAKSKPEKPLVCLTAYTAPAAHWMAPHCDFLLVGDSVAMVLYGMENTLGADLDMMIRHAGAVRRGAPDACIIVDMPAGTYEESTAQAVAHAQRVMKESGGDGVKIEGGIAMAPQVSALTHAGIPVLGHIGLLPQSAPREGGYKVKGRSEEAAQELIKDAQALEKAGAFAIVIEATVEPISAAISQAIRIPTIGIGASAQCDGQVLVSDDMLGLHYGRVPKFVKTYAAIGPQMSEAAKAFAADVRARRFPGPEHVYQDKNSAGEKTPIYGGGAQSGSIKGAA